MSTEQTPVVRGNVLPYADRINVVASDEPFKWLAAGWQDFKQARSISLAYGLVFVVAGVALTAGLAALDVAYLIAPLCAGFLIVGPALTVGFYAISREIEAGRTPRLGAALMAWRANPVPLLGLGLGLVLFLIIWIRLAVMIFALSFPFEQPTIESVVTSALFTTEGNVFLVLGTVVGSIMATIAFVLSVFSLPLLLDRKADLVQAIVTSVVAVMMNIKVMAVWAALIVVFTAAGLASFYAGLCVTLPLIGHASWHAYRAVIRRPAASNAS